MIPDVHWTYFAPLWLLCPVLVAVAWNDLSRMKIPNYLVICGLALFVLSLPFLDVDEAVARGIAGGICLAICLALFGLRWLGGGDAKMLPVAFLFIPSAWVTSYMFGFAFSLLIGMVLIWTARAVFGRADADWISLRPGSAFPMGISIAMSGLFFAGLSISLMA